jgi:hypothetical protein
VHQCQRARDDGAAGLARVEELLLVDFLGAGVVADEHHLGALVVALQEQVEQQKEALGDVLHVLVHRTGDIHQAEHHRLGVGWAVWRGSCSAGRRCRERHFCMRDCNWAISSSSSRCAAPGRAPASAVRTHARRAAPATVPAVVRRWRCAAPARAHRAHDVELGRTAVAATPARTFLKLSTPVRWRLIRLGSARSSNRNSRNSSREISNDELVLALASWPALPLPCTAAAPPWGLGDLVAGDELLVARGYALALPPAPVVEHRLADVARRDADLLAVPCR